MKPTGFVELKSSEILERLQEKHNIVEEMRLRDFAERVNRLVGKRTGWNFRKRSWQEAWDYVINDDYGFLLVPGPQQIKILNLITACTLAETVLINIDELDTVLLG